MQNREHNSRFILIGLLGQKRENNFKVPFFVQNSVRNYEFLEISVFCTKVEENNNLINILTVWPKTCVEKKGKATVNLPKLVCVVNKIQGTSICCFR